MNFADYVKPLDKIITYCFIPTLFGSALTENERKLVSLPVRLGGMEIHIISEKAVHDYEASKFITAELVEKIKKQDHNYSKS